MLREERVSRLRYDAAKDELLLECDAPLPAKGPTSAQLLVGGDGFLVGVDLGEEPHRVVVLIGRHEDVDRVEPVRVTVEGTTVRIADARRRARADEPNPYRR